MEALYLVTENELKSLNLNFVWNDQHVAELLKNKQSVELLAEGMVDYFFGYDTQYLKVGETDLTDVIPDNYKEREIKVYIEVPK